VNRFDFRHAVWLAPLLVIAAVIWGIVALQRLFFS
jgi:hypothetical protein